MLSSSTVRLIMKKSSLLVCGDMMTFESMLVNMFYGKKWLAGAFALDHDLKLLGCDAVKKF